MNDFDVAAITDRGLVRADNQDNLCTDGLSCVLGDEDIAANGLGDPAVMCENLLKATIAGGAPDNVTVIAIHFFEAE